MPKDVVTVCVILLSLLVAPSSSAETVTIVPDRAPAGAPVIIVGFTASNPIVEFTTGPGRVAARIVEAGAVTTVIVPPNATSEPVCVTESGAIDCLSRY